MKSEQPKVIEALKRSQKPYDVSDVERCLQEEAEDELKHSLSFQGIKTYIEGTFKAMGLSSSSLAKCGAWIRISLICLVPVGVVAGLIWVMCVTDVNHVIWATRILGILAAIVPVLAFFKIVFHPWVCIYRALLPKATQSREPLERELPDVFDARENGAEASSDTKQKKKFSVLDPCGLLEDREWKELTGLLFDRYRSRPCTLVFWMAGLVTGIQLTYVIVNIVNMTKSRDPKGILAIRILFNIYSFPFVTLANVTVLFTRWNKLKEQKTPPKPRVVWIVKLISCVFMIIVFLMLIAVTIFIKANKPFVLADLTYIPPKYENITSHSAAPFCQTTADMWSVLELAGFSMAAHQLETGHEKVLPPILSYLADSPRYFDNWTIVLVVNKSPNDPSGKLIPSLYVSDDHRPNGVLAFQGVANMESAGLLLENIVAYWYDSLISAIVPLFEVVKDIFMGSLLTEMTVEAQKYFLGLSEASPEFFRRGIRATQEAINGSEKVPVLTGHMSGGLIAKALGIANETYAVAFESPRFVHSRLSEEVKADKKLPGGAKMGTRNIINVFSNTSLFSVSDMTASDNIQLPKFQNIFQPATPYETFCLAAAGCVSDDRFDQLCGAAVGGEKYMRYFDRWKRPRTQITATSADADVSSSRQEQGKRGWTASSRTVE
jgi:hypothetical protein